jgi:peptide/nickel transport system substrate-binding protein
MTNFESRTVEDTGEPVRGRGRWTALPPIVALAVAATLVACGGGGDDGDKPSDVKSGPWGAVLRPGGEPQRGGTLVLDQYAPPETLSAYQMMEAPGTPSFQAGAQLYDQLVEYLPGEFEPQPALAKSWDVSSDGLTYTFHLRPGVKFSNGMPFTSADVKFTLDHARGPKSFFRESLYGVIKAIETPDPLTAVVKLSKPTPGFLYSLGNIAASILPKKLIKSEGVEAYNDNPVGTGAFKLKRWVKEQEADLERNPHYWRKGRPYLDAVKLRVTPNDNTRVLNVTSGTSDVADTVPFSQIKRLNAGGDAKVLVGAGGDMYVIWPNNSKKPFKELAVRRALNYATPRDDINKVAFGGVATVMNTVYQKLKYWNKDAQGYPYDIEKAKAELAKSSVPDGFSTTITIVGSDQTSNQVAQILQQSWAKIGVKLTIERLSNATAATKWQSGDGDLNLFTPGAFSSDVPVDDEFTALLFNSPATNNLFTYLKNPEAQRLTEEASTTLDEDKRTERFHRLQVVTIEDPPVIPLVYTPNRAAVRNDVHGFNYLMAGAYWRLDSVWKGG